jgi:signal peptidase I
MDEQISNLNTNPESSPESTITHITQPVQEEKKEHPFLEVIKFFALAAMIVLPIRAYVAQPFVVNGASMDPTYATGQYLIVDELSYKFESPKRGDVIVFKYPLDPSKYFIKRVIGLPGETVSLKSGTVTITSNSLATPLVLNEPYIKLSKTDGSDDKIITLDTGTKEAPTKNYFVMGDNRVASSDSRMWGVLPEKLIVGRAFVRLFPFDKMSLLIND